MNYESEIEYNPVVKYDIENVIFKNVKKSFFNALDGKHFLYRGRSSDIENYEIFTPREVRQSYMNKKTKELINKLLYPHFHWNVRDGVFTTGYMYNAEDFGESFLFFPIGDYKFVWSTELEDINYDEKFLAFDNMLKDDLPETEEKFKEWFETYIKSFKSTDLKEAIRSGHEIMFKCNKYLLVNKYYKELIIKEYL